MPGQGRVRQAEDAPILRIQWDDVNFTLESGGRCFAPSTIFPSQLLSLLSFFFPITQLSQTTGLNAGSLKGCSHQTETYHFFDNIKNPMRSGFVTHEWTNPTCPAFHWSHNFKHKPLTIPGVNNQVPVIAQRCPSCHKKRPDVATKREEVNQAGDAGARPQELISFSYFRRCTKV